MFADDLIAAYPSAKVILTVRDEDKWYESMRSTIWHHWTHDKAQDSDGTVMNNPLKKVSDKFHEYLWKSNFEVHGREGFRHHNDRVRSHMASRPDDFLVYDVKQGWDPLCQFLGKPVPAQDMPRSDDWAQYKKDHAHDFAADG